MCLVICLSYEIGFYKALQEIGQIRSTRPILSVLGGNAEAGPTVGEHMAISNPWSNLPTIAPQHRNTVRIIFRDFQIDAESDSKIVQPHRPRHSCWCLRWVKHEGGKDLCETRLLSGYQLSVHKFTTRLHGVVPVLFWTRCPQVSDGGS